MSKEPGPLDGRSAETPPDHGRGPGDPSTVPGSSASGATVAQARSEPESSPIGGPSIGPPPIEAFLGEPTRELESWAHLWTHDVDFPIQRAGGGVGGRLKAVVKRLLRPLLRAALGDLYDRQRVWNLIAIETLVQQREELRSRFLEHQGRLDVLDDRTIQAMQEVLRHNDALFARVDQKLDRYRREAKELWHRVGALLATVEGRSEGQNRGPADSSAPASDGGPALAATAVSAISAISAAADQLREQEYLALEARYRGSEEEIAERVAVYLPYLDPPRDGERGPLLDLGCGRGEALRVFSRHGLEVRGVDFSSEMVERCREQGFRVEQGDLFEVLAAQEPSSLGAVVSFHVIEHLPAERVPQLVRLAWRALEPGGLLVLETPSPLALAMSARDFWMDPTHRRPLHPAHLEVTFREAGFEPVHRVDLRPFPREQHLPEISLDELPADQRPLADQVNRLRDLLDDLLFGHRDFGLVGHKPE